ncbi:hypothetical protein BHM03_00047582, partial [Ensete ventricosum]
MGNCWFRGSPSSYRVSSNAKSGGGGFGSVYKGFVTQDLKEGFHPLQVAVKVHDADNSFQGHREWL